VQQQQTGEHHNTAPSTAADRATGRTTWLIKQQHNYVQLSRQLSA
jgi:hypothetical protein